MKFSIRYRLFLSILGATCAALICMVMIMVWSINRGFLQYLQTMEQTRLEKTAVNLARAYAEFGSWDFLRKNPRYWMIRLMDHEPDHPPFGRIKDFEEGKPFFPPPPPPPPPHPGPRGPRWPLIVLDAQRQPLWGSPEEVRERHFRPIILHKETVGYIAGPPPKPLLSPEQLHFLRGQKSAFILSALGLVFIAALFSLPIANRLLRPLRAMATATYELASGHYTARVPARSTGRSGDELEQLAHDFNTMAVTLEKTEQTRRQWVADISHELRTPLSVLRGEIEALLEGIRPINPEAIRSLYAETLRLHRLIEDLYQLALSDLGTLTYQKEDLDPVEVLRESIDAFRPEFVQKGIALHTKITSGVRRTLWGDSARLHQLFTNLLENSLKYTDPGGELLIRLLDHEERIEIHFEDSAPGVPEEDLSRLFERLYRVEGSRNRASGGAGLGLAICRNIVEAHGGTITASPSPLGGVSIRLSFPTVEEGE